MNAARREAVTQMIQDVEGLIQLASWQVTLAREFKARLSDFGNQAAGISPPAGVPSTRRRRQKRQ